MSDISLIEFIVYGFVAYSSLLMLIISTIKEVPVTRSLAGIRVIYLIPGIICSGVLAYSGVHINGWSQTITTLVRNGTSNVLLTNSTQTLQAQQITLMNPVWQTVHFMIMIVMVVYVLMNLFNIVGKTE